MSLTSESFRIFQRAGVDVDNIGIATGQNNLHGIPGRIYCQKFWIARSGERINSHIMSVYSGNEDYEGKQWISYAGCRYKQTDDIQEIESELYKSIATGYSASTYLRSLYACDSRLSYSVSRIREWILNNGTKRQLSYMADHLRNGSVQSGNIYTSDNVRLESGNSIFSYEQVLEHATRRHNFYKDLEETWKRYK